MVSYLRHWGFVFLCFVFFYFTVSSALGGRVDVSLSNDCRLKVFNGSQDFVNERVDSFWNITSCGTEFRTNFDLVSGQQSYDTGLVDTCRQWLSNNSGLPERYASCVEDRTRYQDQRDFNAEEMNKFRVSKEEIEKVVVEEKAKYTLLESDKKKSDDSLDQCEREKSQVKNEAALLPRKDEFDAVKNSRNTWAMIAFAAGVAAVFIYQRVKDRSPRDRTDVVSRRAYDDRNEPGNNLR